MAIGPLPTPQRDGLSLAGLKPYEDALDALVSAWCGMCYLEGEAEAFGDDFGAIWVPRASTVPRFAAPPAITWCGSTHREK